MLDEGDAAGVPLLTSDRALEPPRAPTLLVIASVLASIQFITAGYTVLSKGVMDDISPPIFSFIRDALAFPVMLCMALAVDGRAVWAIKAGDVPRIAALGVLGMTTQILYLWGLQRTPSTVAQVMTQASQPMFAAALAVASGLEEASLAKGLGVVLAAGGAVMVMGPRSLEHPGTEAAGICMVAGSALCLACYFVAQKPTLRKYPPLTVTAWAYCVGAVFMGGGAWAAGALGELGEGGWHGTLSLRSTWLAIASAVAFNSVAKYSLMGYANAHVEASTLTVSGTAAPMLTAGMAKAFLGEPLRWRYLGGGVLVALGIGLVAAAGSPRRRAGAGEGTGSGAVGGDGEWLPIPGSPLPARNGGGHVGSWGRIIGDSDSEGWLGGWASPSTWGGSSWAPSGASPFGMFSGSRGGGGGGMLSQTLHGSVEDNTRSVSRLPGWGPAVERGESRPPTHWGPAVERGESRTPTHWGPAVERGESRTPTHWGPEPSGSLSDGDVADAGEDGDMSPA